VIPEHLKQDPIVESTWRGYLMGEHNDTPTVPRQLQLALRHVFGLLPGDHRCKDCYAPFHGVAGWVLKPFGYSVRSSLSPLVCDA
jgi:hypothetical protein